MNRGFGIWLRAVALGAVGLAGIARAGVAGFVVGEQRPQA
jgi:hypothetical protein